MGKHARTTLNGSLCSHHGRLFVAIVLLVQFTLHFAYISQQKQNNCKSMDPMDTKKFPEKNQGKQNGFVRWPPAHGQNRRYRAEWLDGQSLRKSVWEQRLFFRFLAAQWTNKIAKQDLDGDYRQGWHYQRCCTRLQSRTCAIYNNEPTGLWRLRL